MTELPIPGRVYAYANNGSLFLGFVRKEGQVFAVWKHLPKGAVPLFQESYERAYTSGQLFTLFLTSKKIKPANLLGWVTLFPKPVPAQYLNQTNGTVGLTAELEWL